MKARLIMIRRPLCHIDSNRVRWWQSFPQALAVALLLGVGVAQTAHAGIVDVGESYEIVGINFPTDFSETVTFNETLKTINGGQLTVTETITPDGPDAEWVEFTFTRVGGGPLAENLNSPWRVDIESIPSSPSFVDNFFAYWTVNGTAVDPLTSPAGFPPANPNPIDPDRGPVFYGAGFAPSGPFTQWQWFFAGDPYSGFSATGIDTNTANDFHLAYHLTIPEPSSLLLAAMGAVTLLTVGWWRRRGCMA